MKVKKTIWIPVVIGIVSAALISMVAEAQFLIPLGNNYFIGVGEILNLLSAALGGPIAVFVTLLGSSSGHFLLNRELYTDMQFTFLVIGDAIVHMGAMLVVAIGYYKLLYPWARQTRPFLVGWWLTVGVYYYLALLPLQVALLNEFDPGFGATYPTFARIFLPEFLGTAVITSVIWLASPAYYRNPRWLALKKTLD